LQCTLGANLEPNYRMTVSALHPVGRCWLVPTSPQTLNIVDDSHH